MDELLDLIDQYREKFGEPPPILWFEDQEEFIARIREAVETNLPWVRSELKDPPEDILI